MIMIIVIFFYHITPYQQCRSVAVPARPLVVWIELWNVCNEYFRWCIFICMARYDDGPRRLKYKLISVLFCTRAGACVTEYFSIVSSISTLVHSFIRID